MLNMPQYLPLPLDLFSNMNKQIMRKHLTCFQYVHDKHHFTTALFSLSHFTHLAKPSATKQA